MEDEQIDESKVSPWIVDDRTDYEGVYFFGISEGESQKDEGTTVHYDFGNIGA